MPTGFPETTADQDFASRSAQYLASQGYRVSQIRAALVDELALTPAKADDVVATLAA